MKKSVCPENWLEAFFMLVVCGSVASWLSDKLINNHGGLYGRLTYEIKLASFSLGECECYFKENDIRLSRYDIIQAYMITGGIPYYLNFFQKGLSLAQNIDRRNINNSIEFSYFK